MSTEMLAFCFVKNFLEVYVMNNLKVFKNQDFGEVRTVTFNDVPYFVGKDVAEILGYERATKAIRSICMRNSLTEIPVTALNYP